VQITGRLGGGLASPEILLGGLAIDPAPPEKTGFSPPFFVILGGLPGLLLL